MNHFRRQTGGASKEASFVVSTRGARFFTVLPFILAGLAIYGLNTVRSYSDDRRVGQIGLARVEAAANRQNVLESGTLQLALAGDAEDLGVIRAVTGLRGSIEPLQHLAQADMAEVRDLGLPDATADRLEESLATFHRALDAQVTLLEQGE
ncbi:MAG: hypothetical protein M3516_09725, partial [Actinomycetota bacterium]|nr:hypothetical protein [Actinomycetota bacterium]